jgi:hypothetical protein
VEGVEVGLPGRLALAGAERPRVPEGTYARSRARQNRFHAEVVDVAMVSCRVDQSHQVEEREVACRPQQNLGTALHRQPETELGSRAMREPGHLKAQASRSVLVVGRREDGDELRQLRQLPCTQGAARHVREPRIRWQDSEPGREPPQLGRLRASRGRPLLEQTVAHTYVARSRMWPRNTSPPKGIATGFRDPSQPTRSPRPTCGQVSRWPRCG